MTEAFISGFNAGSKSVFEFFKHIGLMTPRLEEEYNAYCNSDREDDIDTKKQETKLVCNCGKKGVHTFSKLKEVKEE